MEHTQCWHACWNQTMIVAKNKIQYLNFRYPVHQSLSEQMWLERLQTADCQEEMFDAFDIAGTQSTLFRSGTEKLPEDCGTWQNIQHLHIQKKKFGMNATTDEYNVQKIYIHQWERACQLSIDWQVMNYATMFTPGLSLKVTKFN